MLALEAFESRLSACWRKGKLKQPVAVFELRFKSNGYKTTKRPLVAWLFCRARRDFRLTNIFPDGKISRARLAVFTLPPANSDRAAPVRVPRKPSSWLSSSYQIKKTPLRCFFNLVGEEGLEPSSRIKAADFKSTAYTNSATRPIILWRCVRVTLPSIRFCRPAPNFSANAPYIINRTIVPETP